MPWHGGGWADGGSRDGGFSRGRVRPPAFPFGGCGVAGAGRIWLGLWMSARDPDGEAGDEGEGEVVLVLSAAQVEHVLAVATGDAGVSGVLFSQLGGLGRRVSRLLADPEVDQHLSRSTLVALGILASFSPAGWERSVNEVADEAGFKRSTVHRYVSTLLAAGLLEQNPRTREYRIAGTGV